MFGSRLDLRCAPVRKRYAAFRNRKLCRRLMELRPDVPIGPNQLAVTLVPELTGSFMVEAVALSLESVDL